jgi:alkaline phosphatase D
MLLPHAARLSHLLRRTAPAGGSLMNRREFLELSVAIGATLAWARGAARESQLTWSERRESYPQGVASGDPHPDSVLLWTRRPPAGSAAAKKLTVEIARDQEFRHVVSTSSAPLSAASDWTCRILAAGLEPATVYWYRFIDDVGHGSRIGRTKTAPRDNEARPVNFTFVSCQNVCQGAQNAYRRMIFEDERRPAERQLDFVLHLGDFIYEITWYPEDRPQGMYDRRLRDVVRFETGEKIRDFHAPVTLDDYRTLYRGYLQDPDLQDARARWPFVCVWDNHEFSWRGWQGFVKTVAAGKPAQTRKVAANQAWFEFQPARIRKPDGGELLQFTPPAVVDAPVARFDEHGIGQEPNNLAAIDSLHIYRRLRFGRNVDLVLTDQHSFQTECAMDTPASDPFGSPDYPNFVPEEINEIFDAGREYANGHPPATIRFGAQDFPNVRKDSPAHSMLGVVQKQWFKDQLRSSTAVWKIWGNSLGTLDWRADPQNLPPGIAKSAWPGAGYASFGGGDWSGYVTERAEIFDFVREQRIGGFAIVCGDRHSFWAGRAAKTLPPRAFEPVAVEFITGSISAPGLPEGLEHNMPKDHPLRPLFVHQTAPDAPYQRMVNMLLLHGVRSCLEFAKSGDYERAVKLSNREMSPHLQFLDLGGHGYAWVSAGADALEVEFVCLPRPLERSTTPDGGPLAYRVVHRAKLWKGGETPQLERTLLEGKTPLSI